MQLVDWSRDGRDLLVDVQQTQMGSDVWTIPVSGSGEPRRLLTSPATERAQGFSPDGRWVLFTSNESGTDELLTPRSTRPPTRASRCPTAERAAAAGCPTQERAVRGVGRAGAACGGGRERERLVLGAPETVFGGRSFPGPADVAPDGSASWSRCPKGAATRRCAW